MEFCNASDRMHCVQNLNNSSLQQQDHNHLKETQHQAKPGKESPSCQQFQKWRCCKQFCCHHDCISAEGMHCISPSVFVALVCLKGVKKKNMHLQFLLTKVLPFVVNQTLQTSKQT